MSSLNLIAAQSAAIEPEAFQASIIASMTRTLRRTPAPPCLLRAPTGSGKTFMMARVLENVSSEVPSLWLWFVPYVNLVQQTEDHLAANCSGLAPVMLSAGRNQEPKAGMVLLSTAQGVARARDRSKGYDADADDEMRTLAAFVQLARVRGLRIGLVVDEAHIGLDKTTEFGKFAHWLKPDFMVMATATPKDDRLLEFLNAAGSSAFESFAVSRVEVVEARLNKRYIEAVVYDLRQSVQSIADLKRTVLRQAWRRHKRLKQQLADAGVALTPLLLVQVGNGEKTVEEAAQDLMTLCKVPAGVIGQHSSDDPDPVLMAAIANDTSKEVLIFKQSAGTGFDAPRAFVLASTKPVNDPDFAMQFLGRVMRVARQVRAAYPKPNRILPDLDTAYIYLANAEAQRGFESAVQASSAVKSQLEGQTEKLLTHQTESGAVVYTNRETTQAPLMYDLPNPEPTTAPPAADFLPPPKPNSQQSLFGGGVDQEPPDKVVVAAASEMRPLKPPATEAEAVEVLSKNGLHAYRRVAAVHLPRALACERQPEMTEMTKVSESAAARLPLSVDLKRNAARAALNRLREKEIHTELTEGARREEDVQVITDRNALAREAMAALRSLPYVEEEDLLVIVRVLACQLRPEIEESLEGIEDTQRPAEAALERFARDAAFWVIRKEIATLSELMQGLIAEHTTVEDAAPLPDAMVFPSDLALARSRRNIYGVLPPSNDELAQVDSQLLMDQREWFADRAIKLEGREWRIAKYDGGAKLNSEERAFAQALDRANFVAWWHRNPDRKPYSVRLVRGEHHNYFYPDFVVCLSHLPGDQPLARLIETKENVKDAARKSKRVPKAYGKVLFLTKENSKLRVITEDGSLGLTVDYDDLQPLQDWMKRSRPAVERSEP